MIIKYGPTVVKCFLLVLIGYFISSITSTSLLLLSIGHEPIDSKGMWKGAAFVWGEKIRGAETLT